MLLSANFAAEPLPVEHAERSARNCQVFCRLLSQTLPTVSGLPFQSSRTRQLCKSSARSASLRIAKENQKKDNKKQTKHQNHNKTTKKRNKKTQNKTTKQKKQHKKHVI